MAPTLQDGDRYFLNRLAYCWKAPALGDLAVIRDPGHNDCAVKRIIGVPGDVVLIKNAEVFVNGRKLHEPYLAPGTPTFLATKRPREFVLGTNSYFLLGDNRCHSEDSRTYGPITRDRIIGLISK